MNQNVRLPFESVAWATYFVAFLLVVGPLFDLAASIWPAQPSMVAWRFGAVGILSKALLVPILGSFSAMVAALVLQHRRFLRTVAYINVGIAILLIVTAIPFVLDSVQLRSGVGSEATGGFDVTALRALVNIVLAGVVLGALGISGFKASRRTELTQHADPPLVSQSSEGNPSPAAP